MLEPFYCAILMNKQCNSKVCYLVVQGRMKVNSIKSGRFRCAMIGETQPDMMLLEVTTFIFSFALKADSSTPFASRI